MIISAAELAQRLGLPAPTDQQRRVIEAAPSAPALVVAGAGSGKTETMANRVVWLIANGHVRVDQVLGLTFTRKAAGELAARITRRIAQLRELGLGDLEPSGFEQPTVSTYNAFASALFRDNALLIGREPESALLSDAAAWITARHVVVSSTDERLVTLGRSVNALTEAVLDLSHELNDNVVADPAAVAALAEEFASLAELPYTNGKAKATPYASVVKAIGDLQGLPPLVELAETYALEKRRRGLVEFSDQVAFALAVCRRAASVAVAYRDRYRVVLLDEYQDTSVVQTEFLATLFAGHGVMAVGDPHQSIYGWRGASAANLARFENDFGAGEPVEQFALSTSWRNAGSVLDAANVLVEPLSAASAIPVEQLVPRPDAPAGAVTGFYFETLAEEARGVARWLATELATSEKPAKRGDDGTQGKSAAILFRQRRHMDLFARACREEGLAVHVLGLGGLLSTPEIVDLVSALRVIHDPTSGSELVRLLSGARWAIGPRDLRELASLAGWLHSRDWSQTALSDELKQRMRDSVAVDDGRSIVDALDFLGEAPDSHSQLEGFSAAGLERLRAVARQFAYLRSRAGLALPELVRLVEQELLLDIEVVANDTSALGLANLYAFHDELAGFLASDDDGTLGSFLGWLDRAARNDTMGPRSESAEPGTVQLLTIHGAKGLEWDVVAVPRLVADELPAAPREGTGWVRFGKLPFEFRGDARELPQLAWRGLESQAEFDANLGEFKAALAARHQAEERRLGYVAVTRARDALLLTGSFWAGQQKPRVPSTFLAELAERGIIDELPVASEFGENPLDGEAEVLAWPLDPLGARRTTVERAAALVRDASAENPAGEWERELELLLAERARAREATGVVSLPTRIPASRFKDFVTDPAGVAATLRRPMPEKPYRATRLGTLFHSWVENRSGVVGGGEVLDAVASELDLETQPVDERELERLQRTFEASRWAQLKPVEVEREIHVPFDGQLLICKIDAVYALPDDRFEVVDWKTGKAPKDARDLEEKQLQLALYRLAYATWRGIDPDRIDAVFYYVSDDAIIRPERIFERDELLVLWRSAVGGA